MESTSELQPPKKISLENVVDMIIETYDRFFKSRKI